MTPEVSALLSALSCVSVSLEPVASQNTIGAWFASRGFNVQPEVPVADRGDGRSGRVDLVARRGGLTVAIEIDKTEPKAKSIVKLRQIPNAVRIVVIRGVGRTLGRQDS